MSLEVYVRPIAPRFRLGVARFGSRAEVLDSLVWLQDPCQNGPRCSLIGDTDVVYIVQGTGER